MTSPAHERDQPAQGPDPSAVMSTVEDAALTAAEARAAAGLWRAGGSVLEAGIPGAGAVTRAALLRAAHDARALGLHRGAAAAIRVVEQLRAAAADDPAFRLGDLVRDLRELLAVAHGLISTSTPGPGLRGTARREYREAPGARLYGLCVEPVATASGYAGAVALLAAEDGSVWQVSTVVPGGADVARFAARRPAGVGQVGLTLHDLGRAGLVASSLRVSDDGRISGGRGTTAVAAEGVTWWQPPLADLWARPWSEQVTRYQAGLDVPPTQRPAGAGLLYLDATVAGATGDGVLLVVPGGQLLAVAAHDSPELAYVDNLRLLARAAGAAVRLVARPVGRRRLAPVAFGARWLPEPYGGHVDLGLDRLRRSDLPVDAPGSVRAWELPDDTLPVHPLRRRIERCVEGGRAAVAGDAREVGQLSAVLPAAGVLAERLEAAARLRRDAFGRVAEGGTEDLCLAWLAAATYVATAQRSAEHDDWLRMAP